MEFKNFETKLFIQILLIIAVSLLIAFSTQKENLQFSTIYFIIVLFVQGIVLYKYLNKKNQKLLEFIKTISIQDTDDKLRITSYDINEQSVKKISNELSNKYQQLEHEKLFSEFYLSYVLESVNVGIIAIDKEDIVFHNSYLKKLFRKDHFKNIIKIDMLHPSLNNILTSITPNNLKLFNLNIDGENLPLSIQLTHFKINKKEIKLFSFYNVKSELQEKEINTWQEVIRVISHEIMNSISPIKSLSSTMNETLQEELKNKTISKDQITQVLEGIQAIEKRSSNLTDFVVNYKKLTKIHQPILKNFKINDLFMRIENLFKTELSQNNIEFIISPSEIILNADEKLIEQILINIITNSIQALDSIENKRIELKTRKKDSKICIEISDNGCGINPKEQDKIFLPFYTNKEQGSGIGLSLAQQIMRLHGGSISVQSILETQTTFILTF